LSHNKSKDNVDVVVAHTPQNSSEIVMDSSPILETQRPKISQLDNPNNINNIIISKTSVLSQEDSIDEEEYIIDDNDPQKVLIVPDDDYIINDGEVKEEEEKIVASPKIMIPSLSKHDYEREEAVLDSLRKGEFRK